MPSRRSEPTASPLARRSSTFVASARLRALSPDAVERSLSVDGYARLDGLLSPGECEDVVLQWGRPERFRTAVNMEPHRFGVGEYRYFGAPLPGIVGALRRALYRPLAVAANAMMQSLGSDASYPAALDAYLEHCASRGQTRPTPLLLRYEAGGYNRLHRDLYGDEVFPFQVVIALSRPGQDYTGGEFLLVEQHPRQQSVGHAITLARGDALIFPVSVRAARGTRGVMRVQVRHGLSRVTSGERFALGIIFHDAK